MRNSFGNEEPLVYGLIRNESVYQRFRRLNNFRDSQSLLKRCDNCLHISPNRRKCLLTGISKSHATTVRLRDVCDKFEVSPSQD